MSALLNLWFLTDALLKAEGRGGPQVEKLYGIEAAMVSLGISGSQGNSTPLRGDTNPRRGVFIEGVVRSQVRLSRSAR